MTVSPLNREATGLVVVDAQAKLLDVMRRKQATVENIVRLLHLATQFNLPVVATEQYPRMLGPIVPEIAELLPEQEPISKMDFDCCAVGKFNDRLEAAGGPSAAPNDKLSIILTGVETHICILQTCLSLLEAGYAVHVPQDAVDSRTEENWQVGIELMREAGAVITSAETAIFQVLGKAGTPEFKEMLGIIK